MPVPLPPGRAKLATIPLPTGSPAVKPFAAPLSPPILDRDIAPLAPAQLPEALHKCRGPLALCRRRPRAHESDGGQLTRLLCLDRERHDNEGDKKDEPDPPHAHSRRDGLRESSRGQGKRPRCFLVEKVDRRFISVALFHRRGFRSHRVTG